MKVKQYDDRATYAKVVVSTRTMIILGIWEVNTKEEPSSRELQNDTPYDCGAHGYCYPANRTSDTTCSSCTCPDGTTQVSDTECATATSCSPTPCTGTNEQCTLVDGSAVCSCATGYTGTDCSMLTSDPCSTEPCLQNGDCSADSDGYTCVCDTGYYGEQCQYAGDPCASYCSNGGTCILVFSETTPYCECPFAYYGETCQTARSVQTTYVGCYDDSSADFSSYYVYSTSGITTGTDCANALVTYREANPTSDYVISTMSGTTGECLFSTTNTLTEAPSSSSLLGSLLTTLLATCSYASMSSGSASVYSLNDLCASGPCGDADDTGRCVQTSATAYECICSPLRTGSTCATDVTLTPCSGVDCGSGSCEVTDDEIGYYCECTSTNQTTACATDPCLTDNPCLYGGTCVDLGNGSYTCDCLNLYCETNCSTFNPCYVNKCENGGTCVPTYDLLDSTYTCECTSDWTGTLCQDEFYYCSITPCQNNGTCEDIIGPPNGYNCTCTPQWQGVNCTEDVNECLEDPTLCTTKDSGATCVNTNGSFYCNCSTDMYGTLCLYNKMVYEILNATYGSMSEDELETFVLELSDDPTLVRDIIPFLIGGYSEDVRISLSYTAADLFLWVAYEDQLIDLDANFYLWNDQVLGNCFTFNHMNSSYQYSARSPGYHGGLTMQMNLEQDEYLPWTETASVMVFTSTKEEVITSESVRVNCAPGFESRIAISRADYYRLGGHYGTCITSTSQVSAYYYDGEYTTDGCLRSCYQYEVNQTCSCMDPRYPMPTGATSCNLTQKTCIDDLVDTKGDPSEWSSCVCPNPCSQIIYSSFLSRSPFTKKITECEQSSVNKTACYEKYQDMALLEISLPSLDYLTYEETPLMDFNKFLSYLGGILSILIGISIVSFIELAFLFAQIFYIILSNKRI